MDDMFRNFEQNIKEMKVFPSAKPLIEKLKKFGIHAGACEQRRRKKLGLAKAAEIDPSVFTVILSGNDVTEKKPSPCTLFACGR